MCSYAKPHLKIGDQIELLQQRGMGFADTKHAEKQLARYGYYRLAAYWYPFRVMKPEKLRTTPFNQRYDYFCEGTSFETALDLYEFDVKLRRLVLRGIELIELCLRTQVAYHGGKQDKFIHLHRENLDETECSVQPKNSKQDSYDFWLSRYKRQVRRAESEDFIQHHNQTYGGDLPVWIAIEILDFGAVTKLFDYLPVEVKNRIARKFGVVQGEVLGSWLGNLNYLRNVCAHYSRLWNRTQVKKTKPPHSAVVKETLHHLAGETRRFEKLYPSLAIIAYIHSFIGPEFEWRKEVVELFSSYPQIENLTLEQAMLAPDNWQQLDLWNLNKDVINGVAS